MDYWYSCVFCTYINFSIYFVIIKQVLNLKLQKYDLKILDTLVRSLDISCKGDNFCACIPAHQLPSEKGSILNGKNLQLPSKKGSTLKGKNWLPLEANSLL